jgi:hypothetical protein
MPLALIVRSCPFAQRHIGSVHALPVDSEGREGGFHRANIGLGQSHGAGTMVLVEVGICFSASSS